jgi:hypothetical protein
MTTRACGFSVALYFLLRQVRPNGYKYPVWSKAEWLGVADKRGLFSEQQTTVPLL